VPRMRRGRIPFLCAQKNSPGLHNDRGLQVTRQSENGRALGYPVGWKYMGRDKAEGYVVWQTATPRVKYSDHSSGLAPMSGWCSPGWGSHHPPAGLLKSPFLIRKPAGFILAPVGRRRRCLRPIKGVAFPQRISAECFRETCSGWYRC
jgi:hypothetical protein